MRILLILPLLLVFGCASVADSPLSTRDLISVYTNGDGFWPRTLNLKEDGTFTYEQMTDSMKFVDDEHFVLEGSWSMTGRWAFIAPDKIELTVDRRPARIEVYARISKEEGVVILEPDLFPDILSTWSKGDRYLSLRYLKKIKESPIR